MFMPTFAHPRTHRDGTKSYVLCSPQCVIEDEELDLGWLARNGLVWNRQHDGSACP